MVASLIVGALASTAAAGGSAAAKISAHAGLIGLSASTSAVGGGSSVAKASAALTLPSWGLGHGAYGGYAGLPWWGYGHGAYACGLPYSCVPGTWPWSGAFGGVPYAPFYP